MTSILKVDSIQNAAGSAAMTIDSSGNITTNQLQYITLLRNDFASYSAGDTITGWRLNDSNGITHSNGVCTVSVAGLYLISFSVISKGLGGMYFCQNGTNQFRASYADQGTGETWDTMANSFAWKLSASDEVQFKAEQTPWLYGTTDSTTVGSWSIVRIG